MLLLVQFLVTLFLEIVKGDICKNSMNTLLYYNNTLLYNNETSAKY